MTHEMRNPWMDALLWIQVLCDTIEYVEALQGNTFSKVTGFIIFKSMLSNKISTNEWFLNFQKMIN